jgi:glycosyltransferase involved in cell wall biosynthesis
VNKKNFNGIRVLMITNQWPTAERPRAAPFIVRQVDFLRRAGTQVDVFHFKGAKNPFRYLGAWCQVQRHLLRNQYDLIHAQWGQCALLALPKRRPLIITFRGNDLEGIVGGNGKYTLLGWIQTVISKWMAQRADQIVVVSERLGRHFPNRPYWVIPSGLDLELFRPIPSTEARRKLGLPSNKRLILFAATSIQNPRKRYDLAKAAVDLLRDRFDIELVVAAGVPHSLMPYYMSACDALLLVSMHEGSPNVVKEALACNLPVVSVDVGDVRERLEAVEGCVICADCSVDTIASGLEQVLSRKERSDSRDSVDDLDEMVIAQRVIAIYSQMIDQPEHTSAVAQSLRTAVMSDVGTSAE